MNNTNKLKELKKIDYNLEVYIRKHTEILMNYGNTEEQSATIIIDKIKSVIDTID